VQGVRAAGGGEGPLPGGAWCYRRCCGWRTALMGSIGSSSSLFVLAGRACSEVDDVARRAVPGVASCG
jgi:hypothetical protein